jgi:D-alanine-D-alanine ligase-like ATP-grasp enzyme
MEVIETVAIDACQALDLRDLARIDLALSDTGVPHVVAVDPLPDFDADDANPVFLAADAGHGMAELAQRTCCSRGAAG